MPLEIQQFNGKLAELLERLGKIETEKFFEEHKEETKAEETKEKSSDN